MGATHDNAILIKARARELGFAVCGIARADVALDEEHGRYVSMLEAGYHGPLDYLARNVEVRRRVDTGAILAGAKSIIMVGARYDRPDEDQDPPLAQKIARYARGHDYHGFMRKKIRKLAEFVRGFGAEARPMSDTAPVLERAWAARAGLGFVGKNGLVIAPGVGSTMLLAEVVTTLALDADTPIEERCGRCTLCLDACPTGAFVRPFVLDASRCVSTATIEQRGAIPVHLRAAVSEVLFGCDICQEVCPHNAKTRPEAPLGARHRPHARWSEVTLTDLARMGMEGGASFEELAVGTPLSRPGAEGLARNACLALAHVDDAEPVLREIAERHPSEVVRDAARWSLYHRAR